MKDIEKNKEKIEINIEGQNKNMIEDFCNWCIQYTYSIKDKNFTRSHIFLIIINTPKGNCKLLTKFDNEYDNKIFIGKKISKYIPEYNYPEEIKNIRKNDSTPVVCPLEKYQIFIRDLKIFVRERKKKLLNFFNPTKKDLSHLGFKNAEQMKEEKQRRKDLKIHLSVDEINIRKFKERKGDYFNRVVSIFSNPNGLWYACSDEYHKHFFKIFDRIDTETMDFRWLPINVYIINTSELKIAQLGTCDKLFDFSMKYKSKNVETPFLLDIGKVKKDFDGIELCPFKSFECAGLEKYEDLIKYRGGLIRILIDNDIEEKKKSVAWSFFFEKSSGIILKNYKKLIIDKLEGF